MQQSMPITDTTNQQGLQFFLVGENNIFIVFLLLIKTNLLCFNLINK